VLALWSRGKGYGMNEERNNENEMDFSLNFIRRFLGKTGGRTESRKRRERGENGKGDSLSGNGSEGGNGLLHLVNIAW